MPRLLTHDLQDGSNATSFSWQVSKLELREGRSFGSQFRLPLEGLFIDQLDQINPTSQILGLHENSTTL